MSRYADALPQERRHPIRRASSFALGFLLAIPIGWSISKVGTPASRRDSSGCAASFGRSHSQSLAPTSQPLAWCTAATNATLPPVTAKDDKASLREINAMSATSLKPAAEILHNALSALAESSQVTGDKAFANPLATWRQRFVQDMPDPNWSSMAEAQAESYLAETVNSDIELVSVNCAGTVCEVQAASRSAENSEKAANEWQDSMSAMSNESWFSSYGFSTPNSAIWTAPDGRTLFVSYLTRASH